VPSGDKRYLLEEPSIGDACRLWAYPLCGRSGSVVRFRFVVYLILLVAAGTSASGESTSPATFFICSGNLDAYELVPAREGYPEILEMKLSTDGAGEFRDFTKENLGKTIRVSVEREILLETRVLAVIAGGRLVVSSRDGADTTALEKTLRSAPSEPCGPAA
jgi:hypothetical protein